MKKLIKLLLVVIGFISINVNAEVKTDTNLKFHVFNPGSKSIFPTTSVIIEGKNNLMLVDAQFQTNDANTVVEAIKSLNKPLAFVYISYSDPDYYFGLETVKKAFPNVKIFTTERTFNRIKSTMDDKLVYWSSALKENAPKRLVMPEIYKGNRLVLDGHNIEIVNPQNAFSYLWIPSEKTILGGIAVDNNEHIWLADVKTPARKEWIDTLEGMKKLNPSNVIAGHFAGDYQFGIADIAFTEKYIKNFDNFANTAKNSTEIINGMKSIYPNLMNENNLIFSAKVATGEEKWPLVSQFPGLGRVVWVDFGDEFKFELSFHDRNNLSFVGASEFNKSTQDTVKYNVVKIRQGVYMVYWQENVEKSNVVHIEDYERGIVYTNIANPDGTFVHKSGTMKILRNIIN